MKSQVEPPFRHGGSTAALLMGPYKLMDLTAKKGEVPRVLMMRSMAFFEWWVATLGRVVVGYFGA